MTTAFPAADRAADELDRLFGQAEDKGVRFNLPGDLARHVAPLTRETKALQVIDEALKRTLATPNGRLLISIPPQEGKSTRVAQIFPLWALTQNKDTRIAMVSYSVSLARRNGREIRTHVETHGHDLGLALRSDVASATEWQLNGYDGGVYSVGVGGSLTGRAVDLMIIDDPIKDMKTADSAVVRETLWDWWTSTGSTRLAPGAPVVVIQTRWHEEDLIGKLTGAEDGHIWEVLNIPAVADHRPERGETDALGREPGEYLHSARNRSVEDWEAIEKRSGPRVWAALYQGRPSPLKGGIFPQEWERYDTPFHIVHADGSNHVPGMHRQEYEMAQSWDMAFKDTAKSDYVVGQVWLRIGVNAYLLDQVRGRMNFNATVQAVEAMTAKWPQAVQKFIEDKANGTAVINSLQARVPGMIPIEPEGSKYARASAVSPLIWGRNVRLPKVELLPNVEDLLMEAAGFPNASHDDTIDALSQAVNRLLLMPILAGHEDRMQPAEYDHLDDQGWSIEPSF